MMPLFFQIFATRGGRKCDCLNSQDRDLHSVI
jgi:hypothetical protein